MYQIRRTRGSLMALPCTRNMARMGFAVPHQHQTVVEKMRAPLQLLRQQYQVALSHFRRILSQPLFLYTVCWTLLLAATVTVAALSLEMGFSSSLSPSMEVVKECSKEPNKSTLACQQCLRIPLDGPHDRLCVPAYLFQKTRLDFAVPPIFAGLVVTASALFVQGMGLWNQ